MKRIVVAVALAAVAAAACGPKRTSAASQPTPAAFDPSKSDAKTLATVDAMLTALGGYDKWQSLKELRFELKYHGEGKLQGWFKHTWDRWNGREHFEMADANSLAAGDPAKIVWLDIRFDMFDASKLPFGTFGGQPLGEDDVKKYIAGAKQNLEQNSYFLVVLYKLHDPGVHLSDGGEVKDFQGATDLCKPSCTGVKVTFDPEVGKDTWQIDVNTDTHQPQMIEKIVDQGRIAYRIDGWTDAGGLKWPAKVTNVGVPTEFFEFDNIVVDEPSDAEFSPGVDRSQGNATIK